MTTNAVYNWQPAGTCWKCGGNIWYIIDDDKYSFAPNEPGCLCELGVCGICGKQTGNVTKVTKVWEKVWTFYITFDWQVLHEDVLVCSDCDELFCLRQDGNCYIGEAEQEQEKINRAA